MSFFFLAPAAFSAITQLAEFEISVLYMHVEPFDPWCHCWIDRCCSEALTCRPQAISGNWWTNVGSGPSALNSVG
ncbi:hypothetical protein BGZ63DRAFT_376131 [Mariannaea sp. PMI_226]|nr:hypothetical protein BGZ63DRAFT_376131 [Mariannaea sp. PMI_226]